MKIHQTTTDTGCEIKAMTLIYSQDTKAITTEVINRF